MIFGTVYRQAAIFHLISDGLECIHYARANKCTWIGRHLKEMILWDNITWSEMGKQNIQAKSVY